MEVMVCDAVLPHPIDDCSDPVLATAHTSQILSIATLALFPARTIVAVALHPTLSFFDDNCVSPVLSLVQ
jgi:hypothetical protein